MDKLGNPFLNKAIRITQTTHGSSKNNPLNLTYQKAIDCNPEPFYKSIYAEGDGVIQRADFADTPASYLQVLYDGCPFPRQLVHCFAAKGMKPGLRVKRGQRIGQLCSKTSTHAVHLHWAFYDKSGRGLAPNPFDYLDRSIKVVTNYSAIEKMWFKNGKFNWSLFKDLKLVIIESCEEKLKRVVAENTKTLTALKNQYEVEVSNLESKHGVEVWNLNERIKNFMNTEMELGSKIEELVEENKVLESANETLRKGSGVKDLNVYTSAQLATELAKRGKKSIRVELIFLVKAILEELSFWTKKE